MKCRKPLGTYVFFFIFILFIFIFPRPASAARPTVTISPDRKYVVINNRPFFPRAIWNPFVIAKGDLTTDAKVYTRISEIAGKGFNLIVLHTNCRLYPAVCQRIAQQAEKFNSDTHRTDPNDQVWAFFYVQEDLYPSGPGNSGLTEQQRIAQAKVSVGNVINYPFFLGMVLADEPDYYASRGVSDAFIRDAHLALHSQYSNFLTFVDVAQTSAASKFLLTADVIGHEHHCYLSQVACYGNSYLDILASDAAAFASVVNGSSASNKPPFWAAPHMFGNYRDANGVIQSANPPSPADQKNIAQKWLDAGATGLLYFSYSQAGTWLVTNPSPSSWPDFNGEYGSPSQWNSFLALNRYSAIFLWNRYAKSFPPPLSLRGDFDISGKVDIFDYNILVQNFGNSVCGNIADTDGNCKVDIFDYNILVQNFGKTQ